MIVLGPDWVFSLVEFIVINSIAGYFLFTMDAKAHFLIFTLGLGLLIF